MRGRVVLGDVVYEQQGHDGSGWKPLATGSFESALDVSGKDANLTSSRVIVLIAEDANLTSSRVIVLIVVLAPGWVLSTLYAKKKG